MKLGSPSHQHSVLLIGIGAMREYVWLECTACGDRNYRTQKETRGAERLELKNTAGASGSTRRTRNRGRSDWPGLGGESGRRGVRCRRDRRGRPAIGRRPATSVAQLVEHRSPKPAVGGSIPSARALRRPAIGRVRCRSGGPSLAAEPGHRRSEPNASAVQRSSGDGCHGQSQRRSAGVEGGEAPKGGPAGARRRRFAQFLANLCGPTSTSRCRAGTPGSTRPSAWGGLAARPLAALRDPDRRTPPPTRFGVPAAGRRWSSAGSSSGSSTSRRSSSS